MTKTVKVGNLNIGGGNPVVIQSMTNTPTADVNKTVAQILELERAGCELVRCAVPDLEAAKALKDIKAQIHIPLCADIHFDHNLALVAIDSGVDKLRINPGNLKDEGKVREVANACKEKGIPIRIGVNAGSIDTSKYPILNEESIVLSGMEQVKILEKLDFKDIILSFKSSSVPLMIKTYKLASSLCDYPLHLGVTEAGLAWNGAIRSAIGLGVLLFDGIGDTIRVSLTSNPVEEVYVAKEILSSLELRKSEYTLISCPTCGRCKIELEKTAKLVDDYLKNNLPKKHITVAVMGCIVNGPGEAKHADIGIAGGDGKAAIFSKGEFLRTVDEKVMLEELIKEIKKLS